MTTRLRLRAIAAVAAALLIAAGAVPAASAGSPIAARAESSAAVAQALPTKVFKNCTALKKVYKGGVAKSKSTVNRVSGKKRNGLKKNTKVSASIYKQNSKLDRDKDGWACE